MGLVVLAKTFRPDSRETNFTGGQPQSPNQRAAGRRTLIEINKSCVRPEATGVIASIRSSAPVNNAYPVDPQISDRFDTAIMSRSASSTSLRHRPSGLKPAAAISWQRQLTYATVRARARPSISADISGGRRLFNKIRKISVAPCGVKFTGARRRSATVITSIGSLRSTSNEICRKWRDALADKNRPRRPIQRSRPSSGASKILPITDLRPPPIGAACVSLDTILDLTDSKCAFLAFRLSLVQTGKPLKYRTAEGVP